VVVTPAAGSAVTISIQYTVTPPVATISSLSPGKVPVDTNSSDVITLVINGSGFITGPSGQTTVVTFGTTAQNTVQDPDVTVSVVSSTTIVLSIPTTAGPNAGAAQAYLSQAQTLVIGVVNPNGAQSLPAPTSTTNMVVTTNPIINSITSVATYAQPALGAAPTLAPYDTVAIFGTNFCLDCGVDDGQGQPFATQVVGSPDGTYFRYPTTLAPASSTPVTSTKLTSVLFQKHSDHSSIGSGYLLFANNNQINVLVPAGVGALVGTGTVEVVVSSGSGQTPPASTPYVVNIAAVDPGILTLNSSGQGQGAILLANGSVNSSTNPATHGTTVSVFLGGLGAPNSTATNVAATGSVTYSTSCISALGAQGVVGYMNTINTAANGYVPPNPVWTNIDGAVIHSPFITANHLPPCLSSGSVTATVNGAVATVTYAGWVADSIDGLYQVNVTVPSSLTTAGNYPIVITTGGKATQTGVTMYTN
jgi:uncharacterized protein (TIGR03437 family)